MVRPSIGRRRSHAAREEHTEPDLVGPDTRVITLQNGVDSYERVSAILGKDATCPGTAYIAAVLGGPGVMKHTSKFATMRCGRMDGKPDAKLSAFVEAAKAANIDIQPQDDMNRERWQKFIFLSSMAGVNCMMREPIGKVLADPDTRAFYRKLMEECLAVGQKSGAKVPNSWIDDRMTFSDNAPPGMKASMLHDLEAGNRLELDWLTGKIVALGKELGVPTPASEAVYAAVKATGALRVLTSRPSSRDKAAAQHTEQRRKTLYHDDEKIGAAPANVTAVLPCPYWAHQTLPDARDYLLSGSRTVPGRTPSPCPAYPRLAPPR